MEWGYIMGAGGRPPVPLSLSVKSHCHALITGSSGLGEVLCAHVPFGAPDTGRTGNGRVSLRLQEFGGFFLYEKAIRITTAETTAIKVSWHIMSVSVLPEWRERAQGGILSYSMNIRRSSTIYPQRTSRTRQRRPGTYWELFRKY